MRDDFIISSTFHQTMNECKESIFIFNNEEDLNSFKKSIDEVSEFRLKDNIVFNYENNISAHIYLTSELESLSDKEIANFSHTDKVIYYEKLRGMVYNEADRYYLLREELPAVYIEFIYRLGGINTEVLHEARVFSHVDEDTVVSEFGPVDFISRFRVANSNVDFDCDCKSDIYVETFNTPIEK